MSNPSSFERDGFTTSSGDLAIVFLGHGSLMFEFNGLNIYVDPFSQVADYTKFPGADLVLITHEHHDHLDLPALTAIRTERTQVVCNEASATLLPGCLVIHNRGQREVQGIPIEAVPAYNLLHKRTDGQPFHPKGIGNGYVLTFGNLRVYVAGDTENIPEMKGLHDIDIAFLPMNLPYTMTPEMVASAVRTFKPKILYPYHFGSTDTRQIVKLLSKESWLEVRIRKMG